MTRNTSQRFCKFKSPQVASALSTTVSLTSGESIPSLTSEKSRISTVLAVYSQSIKSNITISIALCLELSNSDVMELTVGCVVRYEASYFLDLSKTQDRALALRLRERARIEPGAYHTSFFASLLLLCQSPSLPKLPASSCAASFTATAFAPRRRLAQLLLSLKALCKHVVF